MKEITSKVRRTYGYFNNHFNANAVKNAVEMLDKLGEATPAQRIVHDKITTYREEGKRPKGVQPLSAFMVDEEDLSVADHLLHFTDAGRIGRGEKIPNSDLEILSSSNDRITANLRNYNLDIDLDRKVLKHDCDDWNKGKSNKRMCKHLVKLFMTLPPGQSKRVLSVIWDDVDCWVFE